VQKGRVAGRAQPMSNEDSRIENLKRLCKGDIRVARSPHLSTAKNAVSDSSFRDPPPSLSRLSRSYDVRVPRGHYP
jgi:hypothetical protein